MAMKVEDIPIYHITHVDNLAAIVSCDCLYSDRRIAELSPANVVVGFDHLKRKRLTELRVACHAGSFVGDFVPFYFCPRSVMLFIIEQRNSDLKYLGGQQDIIHLVSTVGRAVSAAGTRPIAFSDSNGASVYAEFASDIRLLPKFVHWNAVAARQWGGPNVDPAIKSQKAAEFLVHDFFPWTSIVEIGVHNDAVAKRVRAVLAGYEHRPQVVLRPDWYY